MIASADTKIAWKIGFVLGAVHLAFSLLIWVTLCRGPESGEGWFFVGILHLPSIWLVSWISPNLPSALGALPEPLVFCGFGTILWFIFGWTMTRTVMLYG